MVGWAQPILLYILAGDVNRPCMNEVWCGMDEAGIITKGGAMDSDKDIRGLLETSGKMFEIYEVRVYEGYRKNGAGETRMVRVKILDGGPDANLLYRYNCVVEDVEDAEYAKNATGNGGPTIEEAIHVVHWHKLD